MNENMKKYFPIGGYFHFNLAAFLLFAVASTVKAQVSYYSLAGASNFNNPLSWTTDVSGSSSVNPPAVIGNTDNFTILAGSSMVLSGDVAVRQLVVAGTLTIHSSTLFIERITGNQATLDVNSSGTLNMNGGTIRIKGSVSFSGSAAFNQSGGDLYIDGNSGTIGSATNPLRALLGLNSATPINITGGSWTFPDPQGNNSTSSGVQDCIYYNNVNHYNLPQNHQIRFGDGVSVQNGGSINGFRTNLWQNSGYLRLGSVVFNAVSSATNRFSTHLYTPAINGDLTVLSGEGRFSTLCVAGNISVSSGAILTVATLNLAYTNPGSVSGNAMSTTTQTISNNGTIKSAATAVANLQIATLNIANSHPTGVVLDCPLNVGSLGWISISGSYQGVVNSTSGNRLRIVGSAGTGVGTSTLSTDVTSGTNGDNDAYVKGPLQITIGTNFNNSTFVLGFPVGAGSFNPISFTGIATAPGSATTIQAEAFDVNPGTPASGVSVLPAKRWDVSIIGANGIPGTGLKVRLGAAPITAINVIVTAPLSNGIYAQTGGSTIYSAATSGAYSVAFVQTTGNIAGTSLAASYTYAELATVPNCVSLSNPANGAILNVSPTFSWTAVNNATSYELYVSGSSPAYNAQNPTLNRVASLTSLSYQYNIPSNGIYYWTVVAKNNFGYALSCTQRTFTAATPNCPQLTSPVSLLTGVTRNPVFMWNTPAGGADGYNLYLSTTSPAYNPANPVQNFVASVTTNSFASSTVLQSNQTYYWTVVSKNNYSSATSCNEFQFTTGSQISYCVPQSTYGCTEGDVVARVQLNTLDNFSGTDCPSQIPLGCSVGNCINYGGYSDYRSNPLLTTTLMAGITYDCIVSAGVYANNYAAWIDFNDDGVFDNATERIGYTTSIITGSGTPGLAGGSAIFPLSIPCNPPVGIHTMRVRCMFNTVGSAILPCASTTFGEIEDYLITISAPAICSEPINLNQNVASPSWSARSIDWTAGCNNSQWQIFVQESGQNAPGLNAVPSFVANSRPFTITGLQDNKAYDVWVRSVCNPGAQYSAWSGPLTFTTDLAPPACPTLISPTDMATMVSNSAAISWSAPVTGGAVSSYKVYFGTSLPGSPTDIVDKTQLSYVPFLLNGTTYLWKVVASNAAGDATGCPVNSFTTDPLLPPSCASKNTPTDKSVNIVRNVTFSWSPVQNAVGYRIYLSGSAGAYQIGSPQVNLVADLSVTSYTVSTYLNSNSTYYWNVVAYNANGDALNCSEHSFKTGDWVSYCNPQSTSGCSNGDVIARVQLSTLDNNTGNSCGAGYSDFRGNVVLTTVLEAGKSYTCKIWPDAKSVHFAAWIDYNDNGIFELSERIAATTATATGSGITGVAGTPFDFLLGIPCNPVPGVHTMRIRCSSGTIGTQIDACGLVDGGETEDYIISISQPPLCAKPTALVVTSVTGNSAQLNWNAGCQESMWDVHIQPKSGLAPVSPLSNPGITQTILQAGGLLAGSQYEVWVRAVCSAGSVYSDWVGPVDFMTFAAQDEPCGAISLNVNAPAVCGSNIAASVSQFDPSGSGTCGSTGRSVWYKFTAANSGQYALTVSNPATGTNLLSAQIMLLTFPDPCNIPSSSIVLSCTPGCNGTPGNSNTINVNLSTTGEYYILVNGSSGSTGTFCLSVNYLSEPKLAARVLLGNANGNGLMGNYFTNPINAFPNFPLSDPYSVPAFNSIYVHVPPAAASTTSTAVLSQTGNNAIVDWVFVELRQGMSGATSVVRTVSALLQADGDVVDVDGQSPVTFAGLTPGNYYVAIRHRNHLGFRTESTIQMGSTTTILDFSNGSVPVYGLFPLSLANGSSTLYVMNSGDANSDGSVDANDTIIWETFNGLFDDYNYNSDYNLDGSVDAYDSIDWESNNGKFEDLQ